VEEFVPEPVDEPHPIAELNDDPEPTTTTADLLVSYPCHHSRPCIHCLRCISRLSATNDDK
jgi:hypothetical protein